MSIKSTRPKLIIDIQYASPAIEAILSDVVSPTLIKKWVKAATTRGGLLTLRFVNNAEGKKLNFHFRKKNYATNVLTFPLALTEHTLIADIIFCLPVIQKEVRMQDKSLKAHLAHLIVHGCLHAQGFDHDVDRDAKKMEALEVQILQNLGITNPYQ